VELFKEFTFEAAHRIPPYSTLHGHSFKVAIVVKGKADATYGWAAGLHEFEPVVKTIQKALDHKYLNDIAGLEVPSLENIAAWIWRRLEDTEPGLQSVTVSRGASGHGEGCTFSRADRLAARRRSARQAARPPSHKRSHRSAARRAMS
jgi:6-pyruvoyltetrahydropterin/6-carboxytetrahydropterin synthase